MPVFAYRGRGTRGDLVTGKLGRRRCGRSRRPIAQHQGSRRSTIRPTAVLTESGASGRARASFRSESHPGGRDAVFSPDCTPWSKAGVPIPARARRAAGVGDHPTLRAVIADLRVSLDAGRELSSAMRKQPRRLFQLYVSLVRVGETTGSSRKRSIASSATWTSSARSATGSRRRCAIPCSCRGDLGGSRDRPTSR